MEVGDFVARSLGNGVSAYGLVVGKAPEADVWRITAGGRTYEDHERDLRVIPRPRSIHDAEGR
jgi:hypothetical protein